MNTDTSSNQSKYFDLHTTGVGYLNRARRVPVKRGQSFLAVSIGVLAGAGNAEKTWFDARVYGHEAQAVIEQLIPDIDAKRAVMVGFKIGDAYPELFQYEKGPKAGQTGISLKGRLLSVAWAKVDGKTVYSAAAPSERVISLDNALTKGLGYVNRFKRMKDHLALSLCALHGEASAPERTYFDVKVQSPDVQRILQPVLADVEAERKVLAGFALAGLQPKTFSYKKGPKAGTQGISLESQLTAIAWIKVDGGLVYQAPRPEALAKAA